MADKLLQAWKASVWPIVFLVAVGIGAREYRNSQQGGFTPGPVPTTPFVQQVAAADDTNPAENAVLVALCEAMVLGNDYRDPLDVKRLWTDLQRFYFGKEDTPLLERHQALQSVMRREFERRFPEKTEPSAAEVDRFFTEAKEGLLL